MLNITMTIRITRSIMPHLTYMIILPMSMTHTVAGTAMPSTTMTIQITRSIILHLIRFIILSMSMTHMVASTRTQVSIQRD